MITLSKKSNLYKFVNNYSTNGVASNLCDLSKQFMLCLVIASSILGMITFLAFSLLYTSLLATLTVGTLSDIQVVAPWFFAGWLLSLALCSWLTCYVVIEKFKRYRNAKSWERIAGRTPKKTWLITEYYRNIKYKYCAQVEFTD